MEQNVNIWKANLTNGLMLGLIGIVYTLVMYFLDLALNKTQGYLFLLAEIVILYFLVKSYRDNYLKGVISYGQAFGASIIICLYYAIIMAVFSYFLYSLIDPGLTDKMVVMAEEQMIKKGLSQTQIDAGLAIQKKMMKPGIIAPMSLFGSMFQGLIMSLIVAAFVRKEGNPLLDAEVK